MSDTHAAPATTPVERLEQEVQTVHVPERSADAEQRLLLLSVLLPIAGLVLLGIGWFGASDTGYVADQIPYLISGGLLGLALIIIGVGLFVRFSLARMYRLWLARVIHEQHAQTDRLVEALERVEAALSARR